MAITPLYAGSLGDPLNSTGEQIAETVNALIAATEGVNEELFFNKAILDFDFVNAKYKIFENNIRVRIPLRDAAITTRNSAATTQTPFTLSTVAINTPRITHNPSNGDVLGLLSEEQRTNLLTYSNDFTNAAWTKDSGSTITASALDSPLGALTGSAVISGDVISFALRQSIAATAGTFTASVFLKAGELSVLTLQLNDAGTLSNRVSVRVNLLTGALSNQEAAVGTFSDGAFVIKQHASGWWRLSVSGTAASLSGAGYQVRIIAVTPVSVGQKYYVAGAQLEAGSFMTSYIPTTTATVTRVADVISRALTTTNVNAGAIFCEFDLTSLTKSSGLNATIVKLNDAGNSSQRGFGMHVSQNTFSALVRNASGIVSASVVVAESLQPAKALISFDNAALKVLIAVNGVTSEVAMSSAIDISTFASHLYLAGASVMGGTLVQHSKTVKRCAYFPRSFTAAEAAAITS